MKKGGYFMMKKGRTGWGLFSELQELHVCDYFSCQPLKPFRKQMSCLPFLDMTSFITYT